MIIPYPYDPSTQDLWLYTPATISWTSPSAGSATVYRATGWNPNSPLYGYRKSLRGINARVRTFATATSPDPAFYAYNDPALEVNKPVYYNSWPKAQITLAPRMMLACGHCYLDALAERNDGTRIVGTGGYTPDTVLDALMRECYRWLDTDGSVLQTIPPTDVLVPYTGDTAVIPSLLPNIDAAIHEPVVDMVAPPVKLADVRALAEGATMWLLDSNHKIVRLRFIKAYVQQGVTQILFDYVKPNGDAVPLQPQPFACDSGSLMFVEVKPPTSTAAGDGVLACLQQFAFSGNYGTVDPTGLGTIANDEPIITSGLYEYIALRGYDAPVIQFAPSGEPPALQTVNEQILATLLEMPIE